MPQISTTADPPAEAVRGVTITTKLPEPENTIQVVLSLDEALVETLQRRAKVLDLHPSVLAGIMLNEAMTKPVALPTRRAKVGLG